MIRAPTPEPGRLRGIFHGRHDKNSLNTCARRTTFGSKACMMISENRFFIGHRPTVCPYIPPNRPVELHYTDARKSQEGFQPMKKILLPLALAGGLLAAIIAGLAQSKAPRFEVDASFPQLPAGKVLGDMSSVAVDSHDHVWMIHRPRTIPEAQRANAAPPVLEFDASGK